MWFWKAVWQAVRLVLPFNQVKGYGLHWTQCLSRQLKKIVFVSAYLSHKNVKVLCKQVLCFHLLPVTKIENAFYHLLNSVPSVTNDLGKQKPWNYSWFWPIVRKACEWSLQKGLLSDQKYCQNQEIPGHQRNTDAGTSAGDIDYRLLQCSTSRPARECDWKVAESTKFSG